MKFTQEQVLRIIKEELESVMSEDSSLSSREISAVTMRTSPENLDSFETALVAAINKLAPNADLSKITTNIAELQAKLKSEIDRAYSVLSAGRKFIERLAAMVAKLDTDDSEPAAQPQTDAPASVPSLQQRLDAWADQALENPEGWIKGMSDDEDDQAYFGRMVKKVKDGDRDKEWFLARMERFIKKGLIDPPEGWPSA